MRTAAIITNYNMPERTDALVGYIRKYVKSPVDIVVVDNGSDIVPPSKHTTLALDSNIQTTGGWLAGKKRLKLWRRQGRENLSDYRKRAVTG